MGLKAFLTIMMIGMIAAQPARQPREIIRNLLNNSMLIDESMIDCRSDVSVADFSSFLHLIEEAVLHPSFPRQAKDANTIKELQELLEQCQTCTSIFVTSSRASGGLATREALQAVQDMRARLTKLEDYEHTPLESKVSLAYMDILWKWLQLWTSNTFPVPIPPPPPQARYGSPFVDAEALSLYRKMVEPNNIYGIVQTCRTAMVTATVCECGSIYRDGKCDEIEDDAEMANFFSLVAYCGHADTLRTKAIELALPMLFWAADCVQQDAWKPGDQRTNHNLLEVIAELLRTAKTTVVERHRAIRNSIDSEILISELTTRYHEMTEVKNRMVEDVSLMDRFNAVSVARPSTVCLQKGCKANVDALVEDLNLQITSIDVKNGVAEVSQKITEMTDQVLDNLERLGDAMQANMEALAQVTANLSVALSTQTAQHFSLMASNFRDDKDHEAKNLEDETQGLKESFANGVTAVIEDQSKLNESLATLNGLADQLGPVVQEFYDCKKKQELAELARKRAFAIFDIVKGAFQVVAEVGIFIATGGLSSAAKAAVQFGRKGKEALETAKAFIKKVVSKSRSKYRTSKPEPSSQPRKKPTNKEEVKQDSVFQSVVDTIGANDALIDLAAEKIIGSLIGGGDSEEDDDLLGYVSSTFQVLGDVGVPGAEGMATILGGVQVLANYEDAKEDIGEEYEKNMAKSKEAFQTLANFAVSIGEFFSELVLEFYQLTNGTIPEVSVIEGRSTSFWESMQKTVIYFIQRTDMYTDFQSVASRRLSSEERLLDAVEMQHGQGTSVELRLRGRALVQMFSTNPSAITTPTQFRRALDDKEGCPDETLREYARTGLDFFDQYMLALDQAMLAGRTMHERLVEMVRLCRQVRTKSLQQGAALSSRDRWGKASEDFKRGSQDTGKTLEAFKGSLLTFKRSAPEVLGRRDAKVFKAMRMLQENTIREACTASWYADLSGLRGCRFRSSKVFKNARDPAQQFSNLKSILESIKDDFQDSRATNDLSRIDWFRIPVATALEIKAQLRYGTASAAFQFDLHNLPDQFAGCGYNMEVRHRVILFENTSDVDIAHLQSKAEDYSDISIGAQGPFLKLDKLSRRHVFDVRNVRPPGKTRLRVFKEGQDGFDDCGSPNFEVDSFILRDRIGTKLCVEVPSQELDPLPLLGTYKIPLDAALSERIHEGDDQAQLVMYVKLAVNDLSDSCKANKFRLLTNDPSEETKGGVGTGVIVGSSLGAVLALAAGVFIAKKHFGEQMTAMGQQLTAEIRELTDRVGFGQGTKSTLSKNSFVAVNCNRLAVTTNPKHDDLSL